MFFVIIASLLFGDVLAWKLAIRHIRRIHAGRLVVWACHAFFAMQTSYVLITVLMVVLGTVGMRSRLNWIPSPVLALIYVWHLVFLPLSLVMWLFAGSFATGRRLVRLAVDAKAPPLQPCPAISASSPAAGCSTGDGPALISRRSLLRTSLVAAPPLLAMGTTGYALAEVSSFRTNRLRLPVAGLPAELEGMRIAHVSDLHVGKWTSDAFLADVVERTNALNADIILFTGDLIDFSIGYLPAGVKVIKQLRAPHGVYMIEGNHDLFEDPLTFRRTLLDEGLRFLRGDTATILHQGARLQLLGLPWTRPGAPMNDGIEQLMAQRDPAAFPILLAHHPHAFDPAAAAGLPITLSGHTHGGQLALSREVNAGSLMFRYISGLYQKGNSRLFVSNGTGNWFPLRIGAPAEIIDITLVRAPESPMA